MSAQPKAVFTQLAPDGRRDRLVLDHGAHFGRMLYPEKGSPRELPGVFRKATRAIAIEGDDLVSRNHALLLHENGCWLLSDLNSLNGTEVNGYRLPLDMEVILKDGDRVKMGGTIFTFTREMIETNAAVLVGYEGFPPLRGVCNDIKSMKRALPTRGFDPSEIRVINGAGATKAAILSAMEACKAVVCDDSLFVFYFSGHGGNLGLSVHEGALRPKKLFDAIGGMRGKKLVLLDCCHASNFIANGIPPDTLVITGENPSGRMYEGSVTRPTNWHTENTENIQGFLTRAFIKLLENHPGRIDLKNVADELGEYWRLRHKDVEVAVEGASITVHSMLHHLGLGKD